MSEPETMSKVPGNNNATYGPVPKAEQLFAIEVFETAPSPIVADHILSQLLRGEIPQYKEPDNLDNLLATATFSITVSAVLEDGQVDDPRTYTIPLRTTAFRDAAHFSIRNVEGEYVEHLGRGRHDIVSDAIILAMFLRTGKWTFEAVARLGDGTCLFALTLTQWLEGQMKG